MEWSSFNLNETLTSNLSHLFPSPTEIQEKVLVYTTSKVDLLIQARTGEGKTLCYAIPIVNYILNIYSRSEEIIKQISPVALILLPTRELGVQVKHHIEQILIDKDTNKNLFKIKIAEVLGGFAKPKQIKILNKMNPEIIIATPGRLWELIENEESDLFDNIRNLKFLVIDEADRMTESGHFKELKSIIEFVYSRVEIRQKGKMSKGKIKENVKKYAGVIEEDVDLEENEKIAKKLNVNVEDIETIDPIELMKNEDFQEGDEEIEKVEEEKVEEIEEEEELLDTKKLKKEKGKDAQMNVEYSNKVLMRTILCSATIDQVHKAKTKKDKKNKTKNPQSQEEKHFHNLIKNLKFYNKLIYLKLKNSDNLLPEEMTKKDNTLLPLSTENPSLLPSKLILECYKCDASTKDYYLYFLLRDNQKSKIIIFTNSISHTKKLYSIFTYFSEFKCTCLHSKMLQSVRIKNLDHFSHNETPILFCTDIGARGLDIPKVDLVIHYHIPQKTETFIHRSGRTARANQKGKVASLISEKEFGLYKKIMIDLQYKEFGMKSLNLQQLEKIKSLFEYAKEIERKNFQIKKANREKQWYQKAAQQCEMIYSDEEERDDERNEEKKEEKFLNKKRKMIIKEKFNKKKIYTKLNENNIKRSSFLTPDQVDKLNKLMKEDSLKKENLTQALFEASNDARAIRFREKPKKRRYMHRRKGK